MVTKSVWGPCVWILFHTISHKVVAEEFNNLKTDIIQYIQRICANLPCPECTQHAMDYMKQNSRRINAITTKEHLQEFLVDFHNAVNVRKGKPTFTYQQAQIPSSKNKSSVSIFFPNLRGTIKRQSKNVHKWISETDFIV